MLKVKSRAGESVQQMIRRFKKLCEKEGLIRDMKRMAYYEKPSEKNRRRMRKAQRNVPRWKKFHKKNIPLLLIQQAKHSCKFSAAAQLKSPTRNPHKAIAATHELQAKFAPIPSQVRPLKIFTQRVPPAIARQARTDPWLPRSPW